MGLGWGALAGGIGKLLDKLPIQGRVERWKNELETLQKEKNNLMKGACDEKKANRVLAIDKRCDYLMQLLRNNTNAND
jgi:hypothetical protein